MERQGWIVAAVWLTCVLLSLAAKATSQVEQPFSGSLDDPAIQYHGRPVSDPVAVLNAKLASGQSHLTYETASGYLRAVLAALNVPGESQVLVFSKTGVQGALTRPSNPRALLFNQAVVVGFIRGSSFLELAAQDPQQGTIFYTLDQSVQAQPQFRRQDRCLTCHVSLNTLDVPGMLVRSQFTAPDGTSLRQLGQYLVDHRTPFAQRWGGYYVTSAHAAVPHMGNVMVSDRTRLPESTRNATLTVAALADKVDTSSYPASTSDIVALMVFDHQMRMMNLLTRVGWETRVAMSEHRLDFSEPAQRGVIENAVEYMLFIDEAPLVDQVDRSPFAVRFEREGPHDRKHRSLRDLDLRRRLLKYPCSYMIQSGAFFGLPNEAKQAIYKSMWSILSGQKTNRKFARLTKSDRQAIVEILRDTQPGLPAYFYDAVKQ